MTDVKHDHWHHLIVDILQSGTINVPHLLLKHYKRMQLNEEQAMLLIQLLSFRQHEGKTFPTVYELVERMTLDSKTVAKHLQYLTSRKYIAVVEEMDEHGLRSTRYDFQPLYEKLAEFRIQEMGQLLAQAEDERETGMVTKFEQEFGRPLSPIECEILVKWLEEDKLSDELILAALKEAVFAGKLNFKYIDRILFEWQRNRVQTVQQAQQRALKFRKKGSIYQAPEKEPQADGFPFHNWLKS